MTNIVAFVSVALFSLVVPASAGQSATLDPRWASWLGCWRSNDLVNVDAAIRQCVVPTTDGRSVRVVAFADDDQVMEQTIVADGVAQRTEQDGCVGERRARWSDDGERLLMQSELRCEGKAPLRTSGITTLFRPSEWLDVQTVNDDGQPRVRVRHYLRDRGEWPPSLAESAARLQPAPPARVGRVTAEDVAEAYVDAGGVAVQAWLMESNADVAIDKRVLIRLAERGVEESVLDLLVARAYPARFEIRQPQRGAGADDWNTVDMTRAGDASNALNPYGLYFASFGSYAYGFYPGYYGFNPGTFGGWLPNYWNLAGYTPIGGSGGVSPSTRPAQAVNGRGYTQIRERESVPAVSRDGQGSSGGAAEGGSLGSSGGGSASPSGYSSGGAGGGGSTGLTAVPR